MNIFRMIGDSLHFTAILVLLFKIVLSRSCHGVSAKSQVLYLVVFLARYLDLFTNFVSLYNTTAKIFFIASSSSIVFMTSAIFPSRTTADLDTLWVSPLIGGPAILALVINNELSVMEILWTFSIYLETIVMLPQLQLSTKTKPDHVILGYMALMGSYRLFYCFNWIYRYQYEGSYDPIAIVSGVIQTAVYIIFLIKNYDVIRRDLAMYSHLENDAENWGVGGEEKQEQLKEEIP